MPVYEYIGRKTNFKGKPLWEILGNLKNYGVGRLVIRNQFQRYPEACYYKILKVAAYSNPVYQIRPAFVNRLEPRKCVVLVEEVFRGMKNDEIVQLFAETWKDDYELIPKDEEYKYFENKKQREMVIVPRSMELPPLMKEIYMRNLKAKGVKADKPPEMQVIYCTTRLGVKNYRIAKEGETPTRELKIGLGEPASPHLYANLKEI